MDNDRSLSSGVWSSSNPLPADNANGLLSYVQTLQPEAIARLSRPDSQEVLRMMEQNISGLLGNLPMNGFNVEITTNRENLGRLLASAMMSGYFLRNAEQRFAFEQSLEQAFPTKLDSDPAV
jgi:hypothetical protein